MIIITLKKLVITFSICILFIFSCSNPGSEKTNLSLTEGWEFKQADDTSLGWMQARVPGEVHTDLLMNKRIEDPFYRTNEKDLQWIEEKNWTYQKTFDVPARVLKKNNIELVFEGLDTYADVCLNKEKILEADNMYITWRIDCKDKIKKSGNTLEIRFRSAVKETEEKHKALLQVYNPARADKNILTRKAPYHYGWDWGPRFVGAGIWRPVYLESWDDVKINNIQYIQKSLDDKLAKLLAVIKISSDLDQPGTIEIKNERTILAAKDFQLKKGAHQYSLSFEINNPIRWYPATHGKPHLYSITATVKTKNITDTDKTRIGLRTIEVVHKEDEQGKSFYFKVNGNPMFMKGANYIPADIFLTNIKKTEYADLLQSALDANMNMLRIWGGGIYEEDTFYELCDEMGILLWQDFMFACTKLPGDDEFINSFRTEAIQNIRRIRNHPSIAIWCGNNEIEWLTFRYDDFTEEWKKNYTKIFHQVLPKILAEHDPTRFYTSSSPSANLDDYKTANKIGYGDKHDWGVWHGYAESNQYEKYDEYTSRFMSEYGFQAFPSFATIKSFTLPEDWDLESEVMKAHQKSRNGNDKIKLYLGRNLKDPKDFCSFVYASQVLQAIIIKYGIESHRRHMPFCMGTLYWQLNDCWPVASWSSIDHLGKWKALHYFVKKAYNDILVSPKIDSADVKIHIISDRLKESSGILNISLLTFSGEVVFSKKMPVKIKPNTSEIYWAVNKEKLLTGQDPGRVLLKVSVSEKNNPVSSNILYFDKMKNIDLPNPDINVKITQDGEHYLITLKTDKLAKNVYLSIGEDEGFFSDNFFDMIPGEEITVRYTPEKNIPDIEKVLKILTLRDTYTSAEE